MRGKLCIDKAYEDIVEYFKGKLGEVKEVSKLDEDTSIVDFTSSDILILRMDLVEEITHPGIMSLQTLALDVILNGKKLLSKRFEGDEKIILRMCDNLKYSLPHLLEGFNNGRTRESSQEKITV